MKYYTIGLEVMHDVYPLIKQSNFPTIHRDTLKVLQINLGYKCNQTCLHCHVNAGPKRTEMMDIQTIDEILIFIKKFNIKTIDLTGGAPELNDNFEYIILEAKKLNCHIINRCNLTVLEEPKKNNLYSFFRDNKVEIIASLPCYEEINVDAQRGKNVFTKSIKVLKKLNKYGYGIDIDLKLNLIYNPQGPILPPSQSSLEKKYKSILKDSYNIVFNNLYTLANVPILRFGSMLVSKNIFKPYMDLLKKKYNSQALDSVMCKSLLSIDYLGYAYDCDFNQMLKMNIDSGPKKHIRDIVNISMKNKIHTADHCYACTAGSGSSCRGSLT